jgi:superfamily II DNA or RNA helicase
MTDITLDYTVSTGKLRIYTENTDLFTEIRNFFSVKIKNAHFARRSNKFAPQRKYIITPTGICEFGIYWELRKYLIETQKLVNLIITSKLQEVLDTISNSNPILLDTFKFKLRDYQEEVVLKALKLGRGLCILGTGAGKTFVTGALIENHFKNSAKPNLFKCLVIVPDLGLVAQTYDEFLNCGITFNLTKWTGSHAPDMSANVIICNIGILQSQFDKNEWVKYVDLLIVDECHIIKADNKISKIVTKIKTLSKYGFTGTLPEEQVDKWSILGKFGPTIYEKSSYELRTEEFLVNVEIKTLDITYNSRPPNITDNSYRDELTFLHNSEFRNNLLLTLCKKLNNNTLILVNFIEHGEIVYNKLVNLTDKQVFFIRGSVEVDERENIKQIMEKNNNIICVAISAIFSTGVNIKNLHNIIFAAGGKSFVRTVQSIGRGLRKHNNKEKLIILDIADNLKYGKEHNLKRQEIYSLEKIKNTIKYITQP